MCLYELPKPLINFELLVLSLKAELLGRKLLYVTINSWIALDNCLGKKRSRVLRKPS
jgi:hypothetical protein